MSDINIDMQTVLDDLGDQAKKLPLENTLLRSAVESSDQWWNPQIRAEGEVPAPEECPNVLM